MQQPQLQRLPERVVVVGTSGSGKTTMARRLANLLGGTHIEVDALHWGPNWTEMPTEVLRQRAEAAVLAERWVVDGNYGKIRDVLWSRADTIIWLDYSFPLIMGRLLYRTFRRALLREKLWSDNQENLWNCFFSRDSIFLWAIQTYGRHRKNYPQLFKQPEYAHIQRVHLQSARAAEKFLQEVANQVEGALAMREGRQQAV